MARAVGSFGGQQTSGLVGKVQYMPGRHGQVICGRSRAAQKRSPKQLRGASLMPAAARAWGTLAPEIKQTWVDVFGSPSAAYPVFIGSALRFLNSFIAQGAEPDPALLEWFAGDPAHYIGFPLGAVVPSWIPDPEPLIGFQVDWSLDLLGSAMVYTAHGLPSRGRPDLAKFRLVRFWPSWGEQEIYAANGGEGDTWIRIISVGPNDFRVWGERFFRINPNGYEEF